MNRRAWIRIAVAVHIAYAVPWLFMNEHSELVTERWIVSFTAIALSIFYPCITVMYIWARKSGLNTALAMKHFYWSLFMLVTAAPSLLGIWLRHAPYDQPINPYSYYHPETWIRSYIWIGMGISPVLTMWQFYVTNWGRERKVTETVLTDDHVVTQVPVERRSGLERRRNWRPKEWGKG